MGSPRILWEIALEERKNNLLNIKKGSESLTKENVVPLESYLFVCGSKNSGKTSIINKFLEKDEPVKSTLALEFYFARKIKQGNLSSVRDIAQIWELGGGSTMFKMIDNVIQPQNIRSLTIMLVLDLSNPQDIWEVQNVLLKQIKERINQVISEVAKTDKNIEKRLKEKSWERIGKNHEDESLINPLLVPLIIVGNKYDLYQTLANDKKLMISKALRFLSHATGATLQFSSSKKEGLGMKTKSLLNTAVFNETNNINKARVVDSSKPLNIPFGSDSLEKIGAPPVPADQLSSSRLSSPMELWRETFNSVFPSKKENQAVKSNPANDSKFADVSVDKLRQQKDQELERYRKLSQRKAKEAQLNARVGKSKGNR